MQHFEFYQLIKTAQEAEEDWNNAQEGLGTSSTVGNPLIHGNIAEFCFIFISQLISNPKQIPILTL